MNARDINHSIRSGTVRYTGDAGEHWPDCNVASGGHHHPGCSREKCPLCGGQRLVCSCTRRRHRRV